MQLPRCRKVRNSRSPEGPPSWGRSVVVLHSTTGSGATRRVLALKVGGPGRSSVPSRQRARDVTTGDAALGPKGIGLLPFSVKQAPFAGSVAAMPRLPGADVLWRAIVALLSGLAGAWAFAPSGDWELLPVGLAGLMLAIPRRRGGLGFIVGFVFGLALLLPLLRWLTVIGADAWVAVSTVEAVFLGLLGWGWTWLRGTPWWPVGMAASWVAIEELRSFVPLGGLPWGRLAFALVDTPLVRYGRVGGAELVAFATVLAVALVLAAVLRRRADLYTVVCLVAGAAVAGGAALVPVGLAGGGQPVTIAAVQGNVPGRGMDPFAERRAVLDNHAAATHQLAARVAAGKAQQPDFVVWPENSTDIDPFGDPSVYAEINAAVRAVKSPTLIGAVVAGPDKSHVQNVGIVWDPHSGPGKRYVKQHLVPFGEYIPFRSVLVGFIKRLRQIPVDFAPGSTPGVLQLGPARIGDVICFEVAYDGLIRDDVAGGAELIVVQTNNATYTGTDQLGQQFAISRYRAIETGRYVVIAATSGISGIIAPDGSVVAETAINTQAVLESSVQLGSAETLGVRFGGIVDDVLSGLGVLLVGAARLGLSRRIGTMAT